MTKYNSSELDDAKAALRNLSYDVDDFIFSESRFDIPLGDTQYVVKCKVTAVRKSNGRRVEFNGGHGFSWPVEFEESLKSNLFG